MEFDDINNICLSMKGAYLEFPFDETTAVYKVGGKMFCFVDINSFPLMFNLKCQPEYSLELQEKYPFISPGYHMNKKHWITLISEDSSNDAICKELIHNSYTLVFAKLSKQIKSEIN